MRYLLTLVFLACIFSEASYSASARGRLRRVLNLVEQGDLTKGSKELYKLSRLRAYKSKRPRIKYTLGVVFMQMELYHLASLQFVYTIKQGNREYKRKALKKLISILDYLQNTEVFYYALSFVNQADFSASDKDKFYFYQGLVSFQKKNYKKARFHLAKIPSDSDFYNKAQYRIALSYAEKNQVKSAERAFRNLSITRSGVTDNTRVAALMGLARTLYQGKKFNESIRVYRSIPRDTLYWHDVLLESSWAYLRAARFRSAISNFQSLHSGFYINYYQPESLILRAYVYLYICRYYEMEKVLDLFNATYLPTLKSVRRSLNSGLRYRNYFNEFISTQKSIQAGKEQLALTTLSPVVVSRIMKTAQFKKYMKYLEKLDQEQAKLENMQASWKRSRVGRNARYIVKTRRETVKKLAGKFIRKILLEVKRDLEKFSESEQYLRYDMLRGKRELVKKKLARKYVNYTHVDDRITREYYIQNGHDYWPFQGEHWADELGNYHYTGLHNCR